MPVSTQKSSSPKIRYQMAILLQARILVQRIELGTSPWWLGLARHAAGFTPDGMRSFVYSAPLQVPIGSSVAWSEPGWLPNETLHKNQGFKPPTPPIQIQIPRTPANCGMPGRQIPIQACRFHINTMFSRAWVISGTVPTASYHP